MADKVVKTRAPRLHRNMGTGQASVRAQTSNLEAFRYVVDHGGNHSEIYNRMLAAFYEIEKARNYGAPIVSAQLQIPLDIVAAFVGGNDEAGKAIAWHVATQLGLVGKGDIIPKE